MSKFATVVESTGGVAVCVDRSFVRIRQQGLGGDRPQQVNIPTPLLSEVLNEVFAHLGPHALREIVELADAHAKAAAKAGAAARS